MTKSIDPDLSAETRVSTAVPPATALLQLGAVDTCLPAEETVIARIERRRERVRMRLRETRRRQTPEQRRHERLRKQEARRRQTPEQRETERERQRKRASTRVRPFMAVDGEGAGYDALGRQHYILMAASRADGGECFIHRNGNPLKVEDCLEFLLSLPRNIRLCGFYFNYDVTQILRGIGEIKTLREILDPPYGKTGYDQLPVFWSDYAISYQQGQYFRVARLHRRTACPNCGTVNEPAAGHRARDLVACRTCQHPFQLKARIIKGSSRTVYDAFNFFNCSFVKAITDWNIGTPQERAFIARNKDRRDQFDTLTDETIKYCTLECRYLAMLMEKFREVCTARNIIPERWTGAGQLAAALLKREGVPKRPLTPREAAIRAENEARRAAEGKQPLHPEHRRPTRDPKFEEAARCAFYGGRAEVSHIGLINGPIYTYDLHSAYPAMMLALPCPMHTKWVRLRHRRRLPDDGLYLAKITFVHVHDQPWCGLPFRRADGGLLWPRWGTGWYWSCEIETARRSLGTSIEEVHDVWIPEYHCECRMFDWIPPLYRERVALGKDTRGYPLKLAINSIYGKFSQRSGSGPYHDAVPAGLVTAKTRALLIEAIAYDPEAVVMVATDAVFSRRPLPLDIGDGLGQWGQANAQDWPDLFIARSGVYWSPSHRKESVKSRGAPRSIIGDAAPGFERTFAKWLVRLRLPGGIEAMLTDRSSIPAVLVKLRVFHGCKLAIARKKPWLAGRWTDESRRMSFEWNAKRDARRVRLDDGGTSLVTIPIVPFSPLDESHSRPPANFDRLVEIAGDGSEFDTFDERMLFEGMPDLVQWLPHEE